MIIIKQLKNFRIFNDLNDRELEAIVNFAREEEYDAGVRIFEEKALASSLYLVLDGKIEVRLRGKNDRMITIDEVGPGEIFGWSAVAAPYSFTAATWAVEKSRVIILDARNLRDLFEKNNHIGYRVIKEVAAVITRRLKAMEAKFLGVLP